MPGEFLLDIHSPGPQAGDVQFYQDHPGLDPRAAAILKGNILSPKREALATFGKRDRGQAMTAFSATIRRLGAAGPIRKILVKVIPEPLRQIDVVLKNLTAIV